jgi:hypothetical protein
MTRRSKSSTYTAPALSPRVNTVLCFSSVFDASLAHRAETFLLLSGPLNTFPRFGEPHCPQLSALPPSTIVH